MICISVQQLETLGFFLLGKDLKTNGEMKNAQDIPHCRFAKRDTFVCVYHKVASSSTPRLVARLG